MTIDITAAEKFRNHAGMKFPFLLGKQSAEIIPGETCLDEADIDKIHSFSFSVLTEDTLVAALDRSTSWVFIEEQKEIGWVPFVGLSWHKRGSEPNDKRVIDLLHGYVSKTVPERVSYGMLVSYNEKLGHSVVVYEPSEYFGSLVAKVAQRVRPLT